MVPKRPKADLLSGYGDRVPDSQQPLQIPSAHRLAAKTV